MYALFCNYSTYLTPFADLVFLFKKKRQDTMAQTLTEKVSKCTRVHMFHSSIEIHTEQAELTSKGLLGCLGQGIIVMEQV